MAPYLVFGLSLAVTLFVWRLAYVAAESRDRQRLAHSVERARSALEDRFASQIALLRTTAGMVTSQRDVTRDEFHRFVRDLALSKTYPGLLGLGYTERIRPGDEEAVEARMRANGWPNFAIHPREGESHAVVLLEPETDRNRVALGYNMHADPVRREAMERACDTAGPATSGIVHLVQERPNEAKPGFLVYYPVYQGDTPTSVAERRERLRGYVYSPFRSQDFFNAVYGVRSGLDVGIEIFAGKTADPSKLIYSNLPNGAPLSGSTTIVSRSDDQPLAVRYVPLAEFRSQSSQGIVDWIPIAGLAVSLILAGLSVGQAQANRALERQTEELHIREYRQRLLAQAGALLGASLEVDQTLTSVAGLAVPSFADWCAVDLQEDDGTLRRVATAHINPQKVRWARELQEKYPTDMESPQGVPNVLRTGKSELYSSIDQGMLEAAAKDEEHLQIIREINFSSAIIVPMAVRGKTFGTITFVWAESGFHYDEEDLRLAEEIGLRAGLAVDNARLFAGSQRELEERKRAEAQVRELNENLERLVAERTNELEASNRELEAFCYSVSHDLRGPLRSVDGFSKALIEDYGDKIDEEGIGYMNRVRAAARRMDELITALLNLSRFTRAEIHKEPIDITQIASDLAADAKVAAPNVEFTVAPGLRAEADARMVRIILDNLIGNAVKFSSKNPEPRVEIGREDGAFFVRDNGVGFNPEYSGKLFSPFERLHRQEEFPGSGIGLATVQRIVAKHGGTVSAKSDLGHGATFYFTL